MSSATTGTSSRALHADRLDKGLNIFFYLGMAFFAGWLAHSYIDRTADHAKAVLPAVLSQAECERRAALAPNLLTQKELDKACRPVKIDPELKKP